MKKFLLPLCSVLALSVTFTSCKKDKDETVTPAKSQTELLTAKNWKVTAATIDPAIDLTGSGTPVTNLYSQLEDCTKDDITRYETPNVYKEDEGATRCSTSDPQTQTGTWTFNTDQKKITTTLAGEVTTFDITELSENSMKLTYVNNFGGPVNYTIVATFAKQ